MNQHRPIVPTQVVAVGGASHGHFYDSERGRRVSMRVPILTAIPFNTDDPDIRGRVVDPMIRADGYRLEPFDFAFASMRVSGWMYRFEKINKRDAERLAVGLLIANAISIDEKETP